MWIYFDDARKHGAPPRLYSGPAKLLVTRKQAEVGPLLEAVREGVREGAHAAGYLAYEAGYALDPALKFSARDCDGPLLCFGLFDGYVSPAIDQLPGDPDGAFVGEPRPRISEAEYLAAAERVREHLFAGDFYQANLTFGCDLSVAGDIMSLYKRLRRSSLAGWGGMLRTAELALISCSPEQFFTIRNGVVEALPMKGTAPRHADPDADRAEAEALAGDEKQRAENLMIVDLMRNDLARVSETGSVEVPDLFRVDHYPTVHQMVSRITSRLRDGLDAIDVLKTIFPCGSVTGAPKIAAMQALRRLEGEARGAYTGSMGWIEPATENGVGDAAFNVLIRTLEWRKGATVARLALGSGLVVDSKPRDEWAECRLKGEFVRREERTFDLIETMRFDPAEGIVELERHLVRLRSAATDLDFRFDRHAARNELQAATFGRKDRGMVRLLLSKTGAMAIQVKPFEDPVETPVAVALAPLPVDPADFRLRYKTSDRHFYEKARKEGGAYETLFVDPDGHVTEGSRTNVFVERDGKLLTPPAGSLMPGVLRELLLEEGKAVEAAVTPDDLKGGFYLGNIVRGLIPAKLA